MSKASRARKAAEQTEVVPETAVEEPEVADTSSDDAAATTAEEAEDK